jgi:hypothetical protein
MILYHNKIESQAKIIGADNFSLPVKGSADRLKVPKVYQ